MTIRRLDDDVYWLVHCHPDDGRHLHLSEYLVEGEEGYVLIDAGSSLFRDEIVEETNELTDGEGPAVVVLTHSTLPHTENVPEFEEEWGEIETVSAVSRPGIIGLPQAEPRQFDRPVRFAGREFTCIHPLLTDVTTSQWVYDHRSAVLFTAETFGHYHDPGDCELISGRMENGIPFDNVEQFYLDKLPFLDYIDRDKLRSAFDSLFDILEVEYIAPVHGNPIEGDDIDDYVDAVMKAIDVPRIES